MSCGADFTENRCNDQETANLRGVQAGAPFKSALADFEHDLGRARDVLSLFEDCEQDPKNADRISISMRSLEVLKRQQEDAQAAIASVFKDHAWEAARALRAFRQVFVREKAP
jgi:hypothetical protein